MSGERLQIESNDDDGWVKLRKECSGRIVDEDGLALPHGFTLDDLRSALLATGWVRERDDDLHLFNTTNCRTLCDFISEMFSYFEESGAPGDQLLQIKSSIDRDLLTTSEAQSLSLWSYAWLDLIVREDLADEARSHAGLWLREPLLLDAQPVIRRRLDELLRRTDNSASSMRMAPSQPRKPSPSRAAKMG